MTKINVKRKIIGSILLFLFIFSSSSLLFSTQAKNLSSNGKSVENLEKLKLSTTYWTTTEVVYTENAHDPEHPTIAVDSKGKVHVAWEDGSGVGIDICYKRLEELSGKSSELFDMVIISITASIIGGIGLAIVITIILIRKRK